MGMIEMIVGLLMADVLVISAAALIHKKVKSNTKKDEDKFVEDFKILTYEDLVQTPLKVNGEVLVEVIEVPELTPDEHLKEMIKKYPEAYTGYQEYHKDRRVVPAYDRHILRLILSVKSGELTVKMHSDSVLDFSNGDGIWVANKFFAYGSIWRSENSEMIFTTYDSGTTISLYTFMLLYDLEYNVLNPFAIHNMEYR